MASNKKRQRLFEEQNGRCFYCDAQMVMKRDSPLRCTIDHIIPRCQGGSATYGNIVAACNFCNGQKGSMNAQAFMVFAQSDAYRERLNLRDTGELRSRAQKRAAKKKRKALRQRINNNA